MRVEGFSKVKGFWHFYLLIITASAFDLYITSYTIIKSARNVINKAQRL